MLDDLKMIHQRDAQDALGVVEKQWQQLTYEFALPDDFRPEHIANVVYAGMGGSALSAQLAKAWLDLPKPFEIVRDYVLPAYAGADTLCIITSYSGNTEEELYVFDEARAKGCTIAVIASGGKLAELAAQHHYPLLKLPGGYQPRYTVWFILRALLMILEHCGLTADKVAELESQSDWFKQQVSAWLPTVATAKNQAKSIAQELIGKSVVIYAGPKLSPAAYHWKISCNENAKQLAWYDQLSEFNHNEILGWSKQPIAKPYAVIEIRSNLEHPRIQRRFEVGERLLSGLRPAPIVIEPHGDTLLQQLVYAIALSNFTTIYLALLGGIDPSPIDLVEKLKQELTD